MKKTLIALSVLVAAGSVNAATVYDADGLTAEVYGDLEVGYKKDIGYTDDKTEGLLYVGDQDFGFNVTSMVNDDVKVFGQIDFDGDEDGDTNVIIDDAYVGVSTAGITVTAGRVANFVDEIGVANDLAIAGNYEAQDQKQGLLETKTEQVLKAVYTADMFYVGAAYTGGLDGDKDDAGDDDYVQYDLKAGVTVAGADIMAIYSTGEVTVATDKTESDVIALEAHYSIEGFDLGALYTTAETKNGGDKIEEGDAISLSVAYTFDKTTVGAGWSTYSDDIAGEKDQDAYYVNASYALTANATLFAEIAENEGTAGDYEAGSDMGYAVGVQLSF